VAVVPAAALHSVQGTLSALVLPVARCCCRLALVTKVALWSCGVAQAPLGMAVISACVLGAAHPTPVAEFRCLQVTAGTAEVPLRSLLDLERNQLEEMCV
jgi:hypothetical protein